MIKIYCTFDKVSEEFSIPWFAKNDSVAKRNLKIASRREALPLSDIILYSIGTYDQDKGFIDETLQSVPISLDDDDKIDKE